MRSLEYDDYDGDCPVPGTQAYYLQRWHRSALLSHPDCRDPDHPGCESCMEEEFNEYA